jgi:hypothetical protein
MNNFEKFIFTTLWAYHASARVKYTNVAICFLDDGATVTLERGDMEFDLPYVISLARGYRKGGWLRD